MMIEGSVPESSLTLISKIITGIVAKKNQAMSSFTIGTNIAAGQIFGGLWGFNWL